MKCWSNKHVLLPVSRSDVYRCHVSVASCCRQKGKRKTKGLAFSSSSSWGRRNGPPPRVEVFSSRRLNKPISLRYGPRIAFVSFPTTPPSRFSSRRRLVPLASASPLSTGDSCAQFPRLAADELPRGVLGPPVPPRRGAPAPSIG
jgi:hypothetical protein